MDTLTQLMLLTLAAGTPLVFAALGELVAEKSGVLNLGVEGMMLVGAVARSSSRHARSRRGSASAAGALAAAALSLIFAVIALTLRANQVATGLALSLFGVGLSAFVGREYLSVVIEGITPLTIPGSTDLPVVGRLLFGHNPLVYASLVLFAAVHWFLYRTRARGSSLRAVGESPQSAHAIGYPVIAIRYAAVAVRRRVRGPRRRVPRGGLHAVVGRGHDGGPRLDRAGARRVRDVEAVARAGRRLSVRRRDARAVPGAGRRRRHPVPAARDAAVSRDDRRAGDHFARRDDDPAERARRRSASRYHPE